MEHHIGPQPFENLLHCRPVAQVAQNEVGRSEQGPAFDAQLDGVQGRLVTVEHEQPLWREAVDLPAQLRADGPTRPGDQHPLAGEVAGDRRQVGVDLVAAEEVGRGDVADVAGVDVAAEQVTDGREHLHRQAGDKGQLA